MKIQFNAKHMLMIAALMTVPTIVRTVYITKHIKDLKCSPLLEDMLNDMNKFSKKGGLKE